MELTQEQLSAVRDFFEDEELSHLSLEDDLVDHCCSGIEELMETEGLEFNTAFALMRQRLVPNGAHEIEEDLEYLENYKPQTTMKKFVFTSGYVSALCLLAGLVLIVISVFQRENMKLEREHNSLEIQLAHASATELTDEEQVRMIREYDIRQATEELTIIAKIKGLFVAGQMLMLASATLFALTLLPYKFYQRYQRSVVNYAE